MESNSPFQPGERLKIFLGSIAMILGTGISVYMAKRLFGLTPSKADDVFSIMLAVDIGLFAAYALTAINRRLEFFVFVALIIALSGGFGAAAIAHWIPIIQ